MKKEELVSEILELAQSLDRGDITLNEATIQAEALVDDDRSELLNLHGVGYSLPIKEAKESKKIQLVNYIQKNLNPKVNRTDFRSGFEYCYRWINGELNI